jgi:hypothetical protein
MFKFIIEIINLSFSYKKIVFDNSKIISTLYHDRVYIFGFYIKKIIEIVF